MLLSALSSSLSLLQTLLIIIIITSSFVTAQEDSSSSSSTQQTFLHGFPIINIQDDPSRPAVAIPCMHLQKRIFGEYGIIVQQNIAGRSTTNETIQGYSPAFNETHPCENITIGPDVQAREIIIHHSAVYRHLRIVGVSTQRLHVEPLNTTSLLPLPASLSSSSSSLATYKEAVMNFYKTNLLPRDRLPTIEIVRNTIEYRPLPTPSGFTTAFNTAERTLVISGPRHPFFDKIMIIVHDNALDENQARNYSIPLGHVRVENNVVDCTQGVPVEIKPEHACVVFSLLKLQNDLTIRGNRISSGFNSLNVQEIFLASRVLSSINIQSNVIKTDTQFCTDAIRCKVTFQAAQFLKNDVVDLYRTETVAADLLFIVDQYYSTQDDEAAAAISLSTSSPLTTIIPIFNFSNNNVHQIVQGILWYSISKVIELKAMYFDLGDGTLNQRRSFVITENYVETDMNRQIPSLASVNRTGLGQFENDEAFLYYYTDVYYVVLEVSSSDLPLGKVLISRNTIVGNKIGKIDGVSFESKAASSHSNQHRACFQRRNHLETGGGLLEISHNNITLSTRTQQALDCPSRMTDSRAIRKMLPACYISSSTNGIVLLSSVRNCDEINIHNNNIALELYRPYDIMMPLELFATVAADGIIVNTIASQLFGVRHIDLYNIGKLIIAKNNVSSKIIDASPQFVNNIALMGALAQRIIQNVGEIAVEDNIFSAVGQGQLAVCAVMEGTQVSGLGSVKLVRNQIDLSEVTTITCGFCKTIESNPLYALFLSDMLQQLQTQYQGVILMTQRGPDHSFVIEDNSLLYRSSLTTDPIDGSISQVEGTRTIAFGILLWVSVSQVPTTSTLLQLQLHRNNITFLPTKKLRSDLVSSKANVLEQAWTPLIGVNIGPFFRGDDNNNSNNVEFSFNISISNNNITSHSGTLTGVNLVDLALSSSTIFHIHDNNFHKILPVDATTKSSPQPTTKKKVVSHLNVVTKIFMEKQASEISRVKTAIAEWTFSTFCSSQLVSVIHSSLSGDATFVFRNNNFVVENSLETSFSVALCQEKAPAFENRSSCFEGKNTIFEGNYFRFHRQQNVENANFIGFNSSTLVPDPISSSSSVRFLGNEIIINNPPNDDDDGDNRLCSLLSQLPVINAVASGDGGSGSSQQFRRSISNFIAQENKITATGCGFVSLIDFKNGGVGTSSQNTNSTFTRNRITIVDDYSATTKFGSLISVDEQSLLSSSSSSIQDSLRFADNEIRHQNSRFLISALQTYNLADSSSSLSSKINLNVDISRDDETGNCNTFVNSKTIDNINSSSLQEAQPEIVKSFEYDGCGNFSRPNPNATRTKPMTRTVTAAMEVDAEVQVSSFDKTVTTASNIAQGITSISSAAISAVSPSMGFGVARQQAMINFLQNVRDGDCGGVKAVDGVPAADSPTQLSIGSSEARFYVGGAVGNFVLSFGIILLMQLGGTIVLKQSKSSSWNKPFAVFARCNVALVAFVCMSLLLAPTLTFTLVSLTKSDVPLGEKVLVAIIGLLLVAVPTFYYSIWSLFLRSNIKQEKYRRVPHEGKQKGASMIKRLLTYWFEGEGEWMIPKRATVAENLKFDAATPMFEGYNGRAKWFGLGEFLSMFGLAFAQFLGSVVPVNKSCVTVCVVLLVTLGLFLMCCLYFRPFQELFNRIFVPVITVFEMAVIVIAYAFADNPPDFIVTLAVLTSSMQSAMAVIVLIASLSPLSKHVIRAWKRFSKRRESDSNKSTNSKQQQSRSLRDLLAEDNIVDDNRSPRELLTARNDDHKDRRASSSSYRRPRNSTNNNNNRSNNRSRNSNRNYVDDNRHSSRNSYSSALTHDHRRRDEDRGRSSDRNERDTRRRSQTGAAAASSHSYPQHDHRESRRNNDNDDDPHRQHAASSSSHRHRHHQYPSQHSESEKRDRPTSLSSSKPPRRHFESSSKQQQQQHRQPTSSSSLSSARRKSSREFVEL